MNRNLFLFAVLLISTFSLFGQKPTEEDPNVMWKYSENFHSLPAVHPNGNVLIRSHYDVLEINGLTGELIRRIYVPVAGDNTDRIEISQDGTKFMVRGCLVDYESGEVLKQGLPYLVYSFLHPANDKIIYAKKGYSLAVLDLGDNSETEYMIWPNNQFSITAIAVSNDGRFFAMSGRDFEDEYNTYFDLFDAKTLKPIRQLEKVKAEGRTIEYIQFSENAKYVGYGHIGGMPKATFFTCDPPYKSWEVNKQNEPPYGMKTIGFVNDEYAFMTTGGITESFSIIWNINKEKEIYRTYIFGSSVPLNNKIYNSLIVFGGGLVAIDFNKILTSVEVTENENHFSVEYQKGKLILIGLNSFTINSGLKIFDLQGKIIFSLPLIQVNSDNTEIPLILKSGIYIVSINDGIKQYSQKFIVTQ